MRNKELTLDQAKDILAHIVSQKARWGVQYDGGEIGLDAMMDALIVLAQNDNEEVTELKAEITKLNRAAAASNARETKLKKTIEELKNGEQT